MIECDSSLWPAVLAALVNNATQLGMGRYQPLSILTEDQAAELLSKSKTFDYIMGKPIKLTFRDNGIHDVFLYDRDAGEGECARIVDGVKRLRT